MQIKPIITFSEEGELINVAKARGRLRSIEDITERVKRLVPDKRRYNLAMAHGRLPGRFGNCAKVFVYPNTKKCYVL